MKNLVLRNQSFEDGISRKVGIEKKEPTESESTLPKKKMVGEGSGVAAVLAASSAGRRKFYALYVQEGLDFSSNNRKNKDNKEFEKCLGWLKNWAKCKRSFKA